MFCNLTQRRILVFTDVLGQPIGPIFNGQWTDRLSQNVGKKLHSTLRKIPNERRSHLHRSGSLKSRNTIVLSVSKIQFCEPYKVFKTYSPLLMTQNIATVTDTFYICGKYFMRFERRKANRNSSGFGNKNMLRSV
jgi:hypothetical protein